VHDIAGWPAPDGEDLDAAIDQPRATLTPGRLSYDRD